MGHIVNVDHFNCCLYVVTVTFAAFFAASWPEVFNLNGTILVK